MAAKILAGVDIGNSSTEVAIASVEGDHAHFLSQHLVRTTGIKGTTDNVKGIRLALQEAAKKAAIELKDIDLIRLNDAVPVIGDLAMDLISETIITESSMIGHNPDTPGGAGLGVGTTVLIDQLLDVEEKERGYIAVIPKPFDYEWVAHRLNQAESDGISVTGAIVQKDDGVLIHNRLNKKIPIVDEVSLIEKVPLLKLAAIEVALPGHVIRTLSNPYGLSTVFQLDPDQTIQIALVAKALVGNRSAVVIRTPQGEVVERKIEAGRVILIGSKNQQLEVSINDGAEAIMNMYEKLEELVDVQGETGTNVGGMFNGLRHDLAELTGQALNEIKISDFLAVDAVIPTSISGSMAGELSMESGVALASMVKTDKVPVQRVARLLEKEVGIAVEIGGVEAEMAILGALTTPGTRKPIVIIDMGGGSTDAAMMNEAGKIISSHLAGAGDMVTMLINSELALGDKELAEKIKKYPLGKVLSIFHMQLEDGTILFSEAPFPPDTFGKVVIREEKDLTPLSNKASMEKIREIRRSAKRRVFVTNALRALKRVVPTGNLKRLSFVVMVGGSALDFEIPQMLTEELGKYGIVAGFANIRGTEGPRNAVATGLVLSSVRQEVLK
ncbi:diol dehydratase reactivase subunit alpha [Peribacillus cavernae]|uniref:Diol dehydratase reactivase subunit alpha n=1 Tax=Peribacillus cavernae TaxID=1674310 RepID=A0A433HGT2_9BACI|nr:diol dehydratase reactivase subunit alpha [Peribacillus cavernae]MDQ0220414.1 diol dehydratase reactivase alpha subunit [Peribacillus cavernae]RUQ27567.1 diol dehydratase reactivase subunit alpha [Peribacillus cavernae]